MPIECSAFYHSETCEKFITALDIATKIPANKKPLVRGVAEAAGVERES